MSRMTKEDMVKEIMARRQRLAQRLSLEEKSLKGLNKKELLDCLTAWKQLHLVDIKPAWEAKEYFDTTCESCSKIIKDTKAYSNVILSQDNHIIGVCV